MEVGGKNENYPGVGDNSSRRLCVFSGHMNEVEGNLKIAVHTEMRVRCFLRGVRTRDRPDEKPNAINDSYEAFSTETSCRYSSTVLNEESIIPYISCTEVKILSDSSASINLNDNNGELLDCTVGKPEPNSHGTLSSVSRHVPEVRSDCVMGQRLGKTRFPGLKRRRVFLECVKGVNELLEELRLQRLKLCNIVLNRKTRLMESSECPFFDLDILREDVGKPCSSNVSFRYGLNEVFGKLRLLSLKWREILLKQKARFIQSSAEHYTDLEKNAFPAFGRVLELPEKPCTSEVPSIKLADSSSKSGNSPVKTIEKLLLEPEDLLILQKTSQLDEISLEDIEDEHPSNASRDTHLEEYTSQYPTKSKEEFKCCSDATTEIRFEDYFLQSPVKSTEGCEDSSHALLGAGFERYPQQTLTEIHDSEDECPSDVSTEIRFEVASAKYPTKPVKHECCSEAMSEIIDKHTPHSPVETSEGYGDVSNTSSEAGFEMCLLQPPEKYEDYDYKCSLDASKKFLEQYLKLRCAQIIKHSSDILSEAHFRHFALHYPSQYSIKFAEDEDECFSEKFQTNLEQCPLNLSEDSENEYSTEASSEISSKEFPPHSRRNREGYEDEYASDVASEISLGKYNPQSLTELSHSYADEFSYDESTEASSADSPPQSHIKTSSEDYEELSSEMNFSHFSSVPTTESNYCENEQFSEASEISLCSISEMRQSEVSIYFSAAESLDTSLSADAQGELKRQLSDVCEEIHITESKLNTSVTELERSHNGKWLTDTELKSLSDEEDLYISFSRSPEERTMLKGLPSDDIANPTAVEIPCCETRVEKNFEATATKATLQCYPGEKICELSPFVSVLNVEKIRTHCSYCFKRIVNKTVCGDCSLVCYCSEQCQDEHHPLHTKECSSLPNSESVCLPKYARAVAHLIWKLKEPGNEEICDTVGDKNYYCRDLESYVNPQLEEKEECNQSKKYLSPQHRLLRKFLGRFTKFPGFCELFAKFYRLMKIITDPEDGELGIGIYLGLEGFKHSCLPTANVVFVGNVAQVIARTNLVKDPSTVTLTLRFVDAMNPLAQRRYEMVLINEEGFCNCIQCANDIEENLKLRSEEKTTVFDSAKCAQSSRLPISECEQHQYDVCKIIGKNMTRQEQYIRGKILEIAADVSRKLQRFDEAIDYYSQLVDVQNKVLGSHDPQTVDSELKLALLQFNIGSSSEAKKNLGKVLEKVPEIYGYEHPYVQTIEKYRKLL